MQDAYEALRLRFQAATQGMTQKELAALMDLRQSTISDLLSGKKRAGSKTLGAILLAFPKLEPYVTAALTSKRRRAA